MIWCDYLKCQAPALEQIVWQEPWGSYLKEHISQSAWNLWLEEQTKLINEHRLALFKAEDRAFLTQKMKEFFKLD